MKGLLLYTAMDLAYGRRVLPAFRLLNERQGWSSETVAADADLRLRRLLQHACRMVPYYRARLRGTVSDRLAAFPLLARRDVLENGADLLATGTRRRSLQRVSSGGTTGAPVHVYLDRVSLDMQSATTLRHHAWMNVELVCRNMLLWGPPPGVVNYGRRAARLRGLLLRRRFIHTWRMEDDDVARIRETIRRDRPDLVVGYSSALDRVAADAAPLECPARAVVAAAELVTPAQKRRIARYFRAEVYERYGCNEFSTIAHDCREGRLHLNTDRLVVEVLRVDGRPAAPGEIGEVVVTDLDNFAMPLVRYRLGDAAEPGRPCGCGLPFPTLHAVHGRVPDLLRGAGGRTVSPRHVALALDESGVVLEHQLRIPVVGPLRALLRGSGSLDLRKARESLTQLLGVSVEVERSDASLRWPSGKLRPVVREEAAS